MNETQKPNIDSRDKNRGTQGDRIVTRNQRRKQNRRANMSSLVSKQITDPQYSLVRGGDIDKLVALVRDKDKFREFDAKKEIAQYMNTMNSIAKKSKTKAKLLRQAILSFDINKLMVMPKYSEMNRSEILSVLSRDAAAISFSTGLSKDQAYELIALDDFSDFLDTVSNYLPITAPYINAAKTGYSVASNLYNGVKSYLSPSGNVNEKVTVINPKLNASNDRAMVSSSSLDKSLFDPNRVDVPSICAVICPQRYKVSARFDDVQPSAILTGFWEIPVIPDPVTGAAFVAVFPGSTIFNNISFAFIQYSNSGSAFNPTTGVYVSANTTAVPSAVSNSTSSVASARPLGLSTYYKSTVQNSTTYAVGQVDIYHDPSATDQLSNFASPSPLLSLTNIGYKPFYQRGAITDSYTQTYYNPLDNYSFVAANTYQCNAPIVYIFSGCNTSSVQVGTIVVHATWNVVPTSMGLSQLPVSAPGVGPATNALLDTMFTICPEVFMNDVKCNMDLCKRLSAANPTYTSLLQLLVTEQYSHKQYYGGNSTQPQAIVENEISFDKMTL